MQARELWNTRQVRLRDFEGQRLEAQMEVERAREALRKATEDRIAEARRLFELAEAERYRREEAERKERLRVERLKLWMDREAARDFMYFLFAFDQPLTEDDETAALEFMKWITRH